MKTYILHPGELGLAQIRDLLSVPHQLKLAPDASFAINQAASTVNAICEQGKTVYGINTGFGQLASTRISADKLQQLQENLIKSHAAGIGEPLSDEIVKLTLLLKINSLARGYSGVRLEVIEALLALYNADVFPCMPSKGSVGACGDLAPLAHLSYALLGEGDVRYEGKVIPAKKGLKKAKLKPLKLHPKEGLALLNGVQVSTALALQALLQTENLFAAAMVTGSLTLEAAAGSHTPFDERIHAVRGHLGQIECATLFRGFLAGSEIVTSHQNCGRVQDPYSLRCQPQVMGACLDQIRHVSQIIITECNAVSDNPLVFSDEGDILSGGNFHGEPIALAADNLALAIAEMGALAERRIALLIDPHFSQLPAFLVKNSGLNSGFMMAQVTASALASENKSLAHPRSVDSLPTSANQEDHVSMSTNAAYRLHSMVSHSLTIIAIESLAAAQGIDFRRPLKTSPDLERFHAALRTRVPFYENDRYMAADIESMKQWLQEGEGGQLVRVMLADKLLFA